MDLEEQQNILIKYNLMPYRYRLFYRFSLFSFKILNHEILPHIFSQLTPYSSSRELRESSKSIFHVPKPLNKHSERCLSYALAIFVNKILKNSFKHCFKDFKISLLENISILFPKFALVFL